MKRALIAVSSAALLALTFIAVYVGTASANPTPPTATLSTGDWGQNGQALVTATWTADPDTWWVADFEVNGDRAGHQDFGVGTSGTATTALAVDPGDVVEVFVHGESVGSITAAAPSVTTPPVLALSMDYLLSGGADYLTTTTLVGPPSTTGHSIDLVYISPSGPAYNSTLWSGTFSFDANGAAVVRQGSTGTITSCTTVAVEVDSVEVGRFVGPINGDHYLGSC